MIGATAPEEAGHVQTPAILALRSFPMHFNGSDMSPLIIMSLVQYNIVFRSRHLESLLLRSRNFTTVTTLRHCHLVL